VLSRGKIFEILHTNLYIWCFLRRRLERAKKYSRPSIFGGPCLSWDERFCWFEEHCLNFNRHH